MKSLYLATALALIAVPASAQSLSGSFSGSSSQAGVHYSPTSIAKNHRPAASSVIGNAASSPYKCKDVGGISTVWVGVALPMEDAECGPIVAALAWDSCKSTMCQSVLTQNKYIANAMRAHQQQIQAFATATVQAAPAVRRAAPAPAGTPNYQDPRSPYYSPNLR